MRTGDQTLIKELNKNIIMNLIRNQSPISRAQISVESGLNKATVSSIVDEFIQEGLVIELGSVRSAVGRRPRMLGFNATAGYAIGVELGIDYVRVLTVDLAGRVVSSYESPLPTTDVRSVVAEIVNCINEEVTKTPQSKLGIIGVGLGVPGLVDFASGNVLYAPNLGWSDVPLRAYLEAHINLPVFIDNEANTGALAEQLFGVGTADENAVYFSTGAGIGVGIVLNHTLIRGSGGTAGEFGHMIVEARGLRCSCGSRGCLEMYASTRALVSKYTQLAGAAVPFDEIMHRLAVGEQNAIEAVDSVGRYLGMGISNVINGLNPSLVVIGNRLSEAGEYLLNSVKEVIHTAALGVPGSLARVELSSLGRNATATGAASLALNDYFQGPFPYAHAEPSRAGAR
ncbi:ROK family transcriptional regulator [Alicyclobacillus sp. ALC3]|uniref:ROK family transcriptional regulator n=1 Tax=Alicyclobacillus sp. ALC3 TaxID=2796143 RepID=UPI0023783480|nr:ROK family transcriptional regulator [Alicyclobacillus sp. ALC3]WDL95356.1 ROK family transcriptional regulator [Alicyclobacillus sp. ALC3]